MNKTIPKIGDEIYVPPSASSDPRMDSFSGGLCKIIEIGELIKGGPKFVRVEEEPNSQYGLDYLLETQETWQKMYGNNRGKVIAGLTFGENLNRIKNLTTSKEGKYTVLGIDKFSNEDFEYGKHNTAKEALREARRLTKESMSLASDASIATVFYAYDSDGNYLGGDVWNGE